MRYLPITHEITIDAPAASIWNQLSGEQNALARLHPAIQAATYEGARKDGTGTIVRFKLKDGGFLLAAITKWDVQRELEFTLRDSSVGLAVGSWLTLSFGKAAEGQTKLLMHGGFRRKRWSFLSGWYKGRYKRVLRKAGKAIEVAAREKV